MKKQFASWFPCALTLLSIPCGLVSSFQSIQIRCGVDDFRCLSLSESPPSISRSRQRRMIRFAIEGDFLDVEFEKTSPEAEDIDDIVDQQDNGSSNDLSVILGGSKNLIDVSLETGDPRWKETRIPFFRGTEFIDCKLAFMVDLEGQSYGIGVPFDDVVAIVVQEKERKGKAIDGQNFVTKNVDPDAYEDNEEYAELMEIFAGQVQEQLGEEFQLRKTPKVLTVSGGLDKITKDWQNKVVTKPFEVDELLEMSKEKDKTDMDKELDSFYKFMRDELGDEEFEKTMSGDGEDEELEKELNELIGFFDVPGVDGMSKEDSTGLEDLLKSIEKDIEDDQILEANDFIPDTDNTALKLLGYTFRDSGKSYFLVKPLKPYTLVGRHAKDEQDLIRFDLLTPEEEKIVIPKLEELCQKDLEASGLQLESSNIDDATIV